MDARREKLELLLLGSTEDDAIRLRLADHLEAIGDFAAAGRHRAWVLIPIETRIPRRPGVSLYRNVGDILFPIWEPVQMEFP